MLWPLVQVVPDTQQRPASRVRDGQRLVQSRGGVRQIAQARARAIFSKGCAMCLRPFGGRALLNSGMDIHFFSMTTSCFIMAICCTCSWGGA